MHAVKVIEGELLEGDDEVSSSDPLCKPEVPQEGHACKKRHHAQHQNIPDVAEEETEAEAVHSVEHTQNTKRTTSQKHERQQIEGVGPGVK